MAKRIFQSLTGMRDIWGEEQKYFQKIHDIVKEDADFYEFQKIETPILEPAKLFSKGVGLSTDVVQKQMFVFKTKGKDEVALRPEETASLVRSYIEQGMFTLPQPVKLWYWGPFFRYERPQLGRFRQFHQFGFEILGRQTPVVDVQIIKLFYNILERLGLKDLSLEINSIGCLKCRPVYRRILIKFLRKKKKELCRDCKRRLKENPLRILDCKTQKCQEITASAPQAIDYLCEECHNHFKEILEFLDELELPYFLKTHLVRGLDYYTRTVFEIIEKSKEGEKIGALAGGGRYDGLVKLLGGKQTSACGGAGGVERIVALMQNQGIKIEEPAEKKTVFLAQLGELAKKKSLKLLEELKRLQINAVADLTKDSLRSQLKLADKLKIKYVLILGQKEAMEDTILIRNMEKGSQEIIKIEDLTKKIKKFLK